MLRLQSEEHLLFQSNNSDKLKTKSASALKHDVRCFAVVLLHHMEAAQLSMRECLQAQHFYERTGVSSPVEKVVIIVDAEVGAPGPALYNTLHVIQHVDVRIPRQVYTLCHWFLIRLPGQHAQLPRSKSVTKNCLKESFLLRLSGLDTIAS